jgi:anti-anti-sigma regulatory factor
VSLDAVVFVLSGEMDSEHVARLRELLVSEADDHVVLDLQDITLVNRDAVRFLAGAEAAGIRVANCPEYVRIWIAAEKHSQ